MGERPCQRLRAGSHACRVPLAADVAEQAAKQRREQEVEAVLAALERAHGIGVCTCPSVCLGTVCIPDTLLCMTAPSS